MPKRFGRGLFGLAGFAQGLAKSLEDTPKLQMLVAERAIEKQRQEKEDELKYIKTELDVDKAGVGQATTLPTGEIIKSEPIDKATRDAYKERLKALRNRGVPPVPQQQQPNVPPIPSVSGDLVPEPDSTQTIPGVGHVTVQQGDVTVPKSEYLSNPAKYKNTPNLHIVDDTEKGPSSNPKSALNQIVQLENLLKNIPTDLTTGVTAANSKALGGERTVLGVKLGSNYIKNYEDAKPAAAVTAYRAISNDTRLSDNDAQARALPLMPTVFPVPDTDTVRAWKLATLKEAFAISTKLKAQNPNAPIDFDAVISEAKQKTQQQADPTVLQVGQPFMGGTITGIRKK